MNSDSNTESKQTPALPPGMVLGPDGKPCKTCSERAALRAWSKSMKGSTGAGMSKDITSSTSPAPSASSALSGLAFASSQSLLQQDNCPADSVALGRATWTFLHTTAAYYPLRPSPVQKRQMSSLLQSLPTLYPCTDCAMHLGKEMDRNPPDVSGAEALSAWLCRVHNEVNVRLGKEVFDCSKVFERWKDGWKDGSCD